ncbi:potassium channel family protein [Jannaschia aquimarina]|uniref:potassium channel family protein n=1 Tax=Jannaschia aquimarina TaxID=935700 RepID=UPI00137929DF|nr:potassium channel family protein [Jannaschia aquimarina]
MKVKYARLPIRRSTTYGITYFLLVPLFAAVYYLFQPSFSQELGIVNAFYLSAVTATTLGFGDIVPGSWDGKAFTSIQSLLGVLTIGLTLANLSREWSEQLVEQERQIVSEQYNASERAKVRAHGKYVKRRIQKLSRTMNLLITERSDKSTVQMSMNLELRSGTSFSDMANAFLPTCLGGNPLNALAIDVYFQDERKLRAALESLVTSIDTEKYSLLSERCIDFDFLCEQTSFPNEIESHMSIPANGGTARDYVLKALMEQRGRIDVVDPASVVYPYKALFESLEKKMLILRDIDSLISAPVVRVQQ